LAPPLSRHAVSRGRCNGLLLGYTALSPQRITTGVATLARALRALPRRTRR
jgi:DNA-binding transcriptional MocR family regulator